MLKSCKSDDTSHAPNSAGNKVNKVSDGDAVTRMSKLTHLRYPMDQLPGVDYVNFNKRYKISGAEDFFPVLHQIQSRMRTLPRSGGLQREEKMDNQWEATVSTRLERAKADQIWPLFQDFFSIYKWFPGLGSSYGIHGINGVPGCIRYCYDISLKASDRTHDGGDKSKSKSKPNERNWAKERLTSLEKEQMQMSYEIVDSNIGFSSYMAMVRIIEGDDGVGVVEWSFRVDPVEGWEMDELVAKYQEALNLTITNMEADIQHPASSS